METAVHAYKWTRQAMRKGDDMKDRNRIPTSEQMPEEAKEDARELSDEELEDIAGGLYIQDRLVPPSNDAPPIEAPILNPFE